jgi:hypothetical protein
MVSVLVQKPRAVLGPQAAAFVGSGSTPPKYAPAKAARVPDAWVRPTATMAGVDGSPAELKSRRNSSALMPFVPKRGGRPGSTGFPTGEPSRSGVSGAAHF